MENTLTKEERNRVYKKALTLLRDSYFICEAIRRAHCEFIGPTENNYYFIECAYPEFINQKPEGVYFGDPWFFAEVNNPAFIRRIKVLEKCIELTN